MVRREAVDGVGWADGRSKLGAPAAWRTRLGGDGSAVKFADDDWKLEALRLPGAPREFPVVRHPANCALARARPSLRGQPA